MNVTGNDKSFKIKAPRLVNDGMSLSAQYWLVVNSAKKECPFTFNCVYFQQT